MSQVRVLVGTKKGAFVLESDGKRAAWAVNGPFFAGWEIYHLKGSPVNPCLLYTSQQHITVADLSNTQKPPQFLRVLLCQ